MVCFPQDAEEFPNLSAASERRHRVESPKLQSKQQAQVSVRLQMLSLPSDVTVLLRELLREPAR